MVRLNMLLMANERMSLDQSLLLLATGLRIPYWGCVHCVQAMPLREACHVRNT